MIIYSPVDGDVITSSVPSSPKKCFLMTRLARPKTPAVKEMDKAVKECCRAFGFCVIDANSRVSGRDFASGGGSAPGSQRYLVRLRSTLTAFNQALNADSTPVFPVGIPLARRQPLLVLIKMLFSRGP
jgi:hypothetical protein